jgi:hypothetical protein
MNPLKQPGTIQQQTHIQVTYLTNPTEKLYQASPKKLKMTVIVNRDIKRKQTSPSQTTPAS